MLKRKKDGGFTLIELMIVIAVIGILAVVLAPKMAGVKDTAKVTGVQTNMKSVQAYVVSNINSWVNKSTFTDPDADIATRIYMNFQGDNAFKNPISLSTAITSNVGGKVSLAANAVDIPNNVATTDALQILSAAPGASVAPHGGIVVVLDDTAAEIAANGIRIIGYDAEGQQVDDIIVVKP